MPDDVVQDRLQLIVEHAAVIEERVRGMKEKAISLEAKDGAVIVDSLITRLQPLSENIKKIQKIGPSFFESVVPLNVSTVVRFRDLASYHYENLDHAMVLQICESNVPLVARAVQAYMENLK